MMYAPHLRFDVADPDAAEPEPSLKTARMRGSGSAIATSQISPPELKD
ncbi:hypothetical protein GCM10023080_082880 [Streptomyces pseudoechinosporeus]